MIKITGEVVGFCLPSSQFWIRAALNVYDVEVTFRNFLERRQVVVNRESYITAKELDEMRNAVKYINEFAK